MYCEIVSCCEVKNVRCLELDGLKIGVRDAELWLSDIALNNDEIIKRCLSIIGDLLDLLHRRFNQMRLNEQKKLGLAPGKAFDQAAGDKSRETRDED